jgi:glyoxalase family protein
VKLDGIHHITSITADGPRNVDFYARVMGLRMVKQSVNQDDPTVYHLFYADEEASPGADITFFEYPGVQQGTAGAGMIHTIAHRVGSADALDFWRDRLAGEGLEVSRGDRVVRFADPEGLGQELVIDETADTPLVAYATEIPDEFALRGFDHVRAYATDPGASRDLFENALAFDTVGDAAWESRGPTRGGRFHFEGVPRESSPPIPGAGTVHHIAWAAGSDEDHLAFRERAVRSGARATPVIDRFYFRSIYFREPNGVLFELATHDPGFDVDEPKETLGEKLSLPPKLAGRRAEIEPGLRPLPDTRPWRKRAAPAL